MPLEAPQSQSSRQGSVCARNCYGAEFASRADRDAAVAAMKVRDRWRRAVPPSRSCSAGAPELPSFLLGSTSPETSVKGHPSRPASGSLTGPGRVTWAPRSLQVPQSLRSASPRSGERPGAPRAHASAPLSAPGPVRVLGGLLQTHRCSPQPSWLCPQRALAPKSLN